MLACYTDYSAAEVIISTEDTLRHSSKELELPDPFSAAWSCKSILSPALLYLEFLFFPTHTFKPDMNAII